MSSMYFDNGKLREIAIKQVDKPAVYISNHLTMIKDADIWSHLINKFKGDSELLLNLMHSGVFFFETEDDALQFFNIFNEPPVYSSAVYAVLYDKFGIPVDENTYT